MKNIIAIIIGTVVVVTLLTSLLAPAIDELNNENAGGDEIYMFMITGQSNSAYRQVDLTIANNEIPRIPENYAYYLGTDERPPESKPINWESQINSWGLHSMVNSDGTWHIGNYEAQLASTFYHETGQRCLIVNAGWDSASINASQPGEYENTYFKAMFEKAKSLIPTKYTLKLGCVFWAQGEADDDMTVEEYKDKFLTMWEDYQTLGWGSILIAQTRFDQSPISPEAQEQLNGIDHIYLATDVTQSFSVANGLLNSDNQHYSQKGRIIVAKEWMGFYLDHEYTPTSSEDYSRLIFPIAAVIPLIVVIGLLVSIARILFRNQD